MFDTQVTVRFNYKDHVDRFDRLPITPEVCFEFCRKIGGAQFFGLEEGRDCFCTPFFHNQGKGGDGLCDAPCEGDRRQFCGGMERASVFAMHDCANLPPTVCKVPPPLVPNSKTFTSIAYGTRNISCSNLIEQRSDTLDKNYCEVECLPGFTLKNNTLRCLVRGDPYVWAFGQYVGRAVCEALSCGMSPELPNTEVEHRIVHYGKQGNLTYKCYPGFTLNATPSGLTQFDISCEKNETFSNVLTCLPVHCGTIPQFSFSRTPTPANTTVSYPAVVPYECHPGYTMGDGSTHFQVKCTAQGSFFPEYNDVLKPCWPKVCGPPIVFGYAWLQSDDALVAYPQQSLYKCKPGYSLDGRVAGEFNNTMFSSACKASGEFSLTTDPCVPVTCGFPPAIAWSHLVVGSNVSYSYPAEVEYECDKGYSVDGDSKGSWSIRVQCGLNGTWMPEPPRRCKPIVCPVLPELPNTLPMPVTNKTQSYVFGDNSPTYTCKYGFSTAVDDFYRELVNFSLVCGSRGVFDVFQSCVNVDDCHARDCGGHGACRDLPDPTGNDSMHHYVCDCHPGYTPVLTGVQKQCVKILNCFTSPVNSSLDCPNIRCKDDSCGPHGECVGHPNRTCSCSPGYHAVPDDEGETCVEINECDELSGTVACAPGTCEDRVNGFSCACPPGFRTTADDHGGEREQCQRVECGAGPVVQHSTRNYTGKVRFETAIEYTCDPGYTTQGTTDGRSKWTITCLAGGTFSSGSDCYPVACTMPTINHTKHLEGKFYFNDTVTYECLDGYRIGGTVLGAASFEVFCGADGNSVVREVTKDVVYSFHGHSVAIGLCEPISCGAPIFVINAFVETRSYFFPEHASYVCDAGYTTTGLVSGEITFTSSCQADGFFVTPKFCRPVSCGVPSDEHGDITPGGEVFFPASTSVTCHRGHTTQPGDVHGATSYSLACDASGLFSYTSAGCNISNPVETHYCVSDGSRCNGNVCCAGYAGSHGKTFPCGNADPSFSGCGSPDNYNSFNSSLMAFNTDYDHLTILSRVTTGIDTGEIRFKRTVWHDGYALDMIIQAVDDDGNAKRGNNIDLLHSFGDVFILIFPTAGEWNLRFSFVLTGTQTVITLPEVFFSVLDLDCHKSGVACETVTTRDQDMYLAGDNLVAVVQDDELRAYSRTDKCVDPRSTLLTEEQKKHALTLGFQNRTSFVLRIVVLAVGGERNFWFGGIGNQQWADVEAAKSTSEPLLDLAPVACPEPQLCHPISCGVPVARENSNPSSTSAVMYSAIETWTCLPGYSVDGTPSGATFFEVQCGPSGEFLPLERDCIDIDFCADNPCGVHGQCMDCSTTGCHHAGRTFLFQGSPIVGGKEFEASDDYACLCDEHYQTAVHAGGHLTCSTDDCAGHSECGEGGTCVDLSVAEEGPAGEFSCACHSGHELIPGGGPNGGDTCSKVSCGSVAVANSDKQPSVELFSGDSIFVTCDEGYSTDRTPNAKKFKVTCTDSGALDGVRSCSKIVCDKPPNVNHATTLGLHAFYGETLTWRCHEGYTYGKDVEFELICAKNGHFNGQGACAPIKCHVPQLRNAHIPMLGGADTLDYGLSHIAQCNTGYVTREKLPKFVFSCGASGLVGVVDCELVTCPVPTLTNVYTPSVRNFPYGSTLTVMCKTGYVTSMTRQFHFTMTCQNEGIVTGAVMCVEVVYTVTGRVVDASNSAPVEGAEVTIAGFSATTLGNGHYTIYMVPPGTHTLQVMHASFITNTHQVVISADKTEDVSLSRPLLVGEWRWTLQWTEKPSGTSFGVPYDLDSHVLWGKNVSCRDIISTDEEPCSTDGGSNCYVYWPDANTINSCSSTCNSQTCKQAAVNLENDDVDYGGPETLHVKNVGQCDGDIEDCMLVYEVHNYGSRDSDMDKGDWAVRVFHNEIKVFEMLQPPVISNNTLWYVVFTLNLKTGQLCPNWVDFSKAESC